MLTTEGDTEQIRAHRQVVKRLGRWTTSRQFDVRASAGSVVLDLLLAEIEPGEIVVRVDLDHAVLKLLVPDGTVIDHDDLRRIGRGRVKDWTGVAAAGGRVVRLTGELRRAEVRVHRGGVALLDLVVARRGHDVREAQRLGRLGGGTR